MKTKHIHVLIATITMALEYDPQNLETLPTLNAQMREAARKLPGYRNIEIRLGKIPVPPAAPTVTAERPLNMQTNRT